MSVFLSILLCFLLHELRFCSSRKDSDLENALLLFSFHGKTGFCFGKQAYCMLLESMHYLTTEVFGT